MCASLTFAIQPAFRPQVSKPVPQPDDIYEAVIHYQIRSWELAADSYCIKVNGRDASESLLDRLGPNRTKAASRCREQKSEVMMWWSTRSLENVQSSST